MNGVDVYGMGMPILRTVHSSDRQVSYRKPWVTWTLDAHRAWAERKRRGAAVLLDTRRGPIGRPDTARSRAKYLANRARQGKEHR